MWFKLKSLFKKKQGREYQKLEFTADKYVLKNYFWDGGKADSGYKFLEATVFDLLRKYISDSYILIPHVSLREIFCVRDTENSYPYFAFLSTHHVDFLIIDWKAARPVLALELDGKYHKENDKQIKSDSFKDSLFMQSGIPLFRIPLEDDLLNIRYYSALFSQYKTVFPVYHRPCCNRMKFIPEGPYGPYYVCPVCKKNNGSFQTLSFSRIPNLLNFED